MNFRDYVKLGLNHHLLFAEQIVQPADHLKTLESIVNDDRLEILDLWIVEEQPYRDTEIELLKNSNKDIYYNCGNRPGKPPLEPASLDTNKKQYTIDVYKDEITRAKDCGATKVITNSGPNNPANRDIAFDSVVDFYCRICEFSPEILIMIEPTDFDMSKCKLIGSSLEAVEICKRVTAHGYKNIASMVDMCHVPLMHETIKQAIHDTAGFLGHFHLGNCIMQDKKHQWFGDKHVPLCIEGGEYTVDDVSELLRLGLDMNYFNKQNRGSASIEMRALPGDDPLQCLNSYYNYVIEAWGKATSQDQSE